jgi:hypothetical protein
MGWAGAFPSFLEKVVNQLENRCPKGLVGSSPTPFADRDWWSPACSALESGQMRARGSARAEAGWPCLHSQRVSGRTEHIMWTRFFPAAHRRKESLASVTEISAPSLRTYYEKVRTRADSFLTQISDVDFERGLASLAMAVEEEPPAPVLSRLDLLVLRERSGRKAM